MARSNEARAALTALARHTDILVKASLEDGGLIEHSAETENAIGALRRHGLVVQLDEHEPHVQVSQVVGELIRHVTKSHQRQLSCGAVEDLVSELRHVLDGYFLAHDKAAIDDARAQLAKVYELVASLVESLRQISARFASYIQNEFMTVSDLELRIRENRRAVEEAQRLNQLLDTLGPGDLMQWSRNRPEVQRLLTNTLSRNLTRIRGDLIDANHRLRENLGKLERDEETREWNTLIDAMLAHYERNPGYMPAGDVLESALGQHGFFSGVEALELRAFPDLADLTQTRELGDLAIRVLMDVGAQADTPASEAAVVVQVEDAVGVETTRSGDPMDRALEWLFDGLVEVTRAGPCSVREAHGVLEPGGSMRLWLAAAWERYLLLSQDGSCAGVVGEWIGAPLERYPGTLVVTDLVFRRVAV